MNYIMNSTENKSLVNKLCNTFGDNRDNIFLVGESGLSMTVLEDRDVVSALHNMESTDFNRNNFINNARATAAALSSNSSNSEKYESILRKLDNIDVKINSIKREMSELRNVIHNNLVNVNSLNNDGKPASFSQCNSLVEVQRFADNLKDEAFFEEMVRRCSGQVKSDCDLFTATRKILTVLIKKDVMGRINMSGRNQKLKFPSIISSVLHGSITSRIECEFSDVEKMISRVLHNCIANMKRRQKQVRNEAQLTATNTLSLPFTSNHQM